MSIKKPQRDMAVRLLEYFRVFGWTDKDINLRTEPQPERGTVTYHDSASSH